MSTTDFINAIFEGGGACLLLLNVRRLYLDKRLAGVALAPTIWFNVWGAWNLFYYFQLRQFASWSAGIGVFLVNTAWVSLALYYTVKSSRNRCQCGRELVWNESKAARLCGVCRWDSVVEQPKA